MVNEYWLEVIAEILANIAEVSIAQPEVDDVLRLDIINMLEALVEVFKILTLEAKCTSIALIDTIFLRV